MTTQELQSIIEETIGDKVSALVPASGSEARSSKDFFDPFLGNYSGTLTTFAGDRQLWSLSRDEKGWELSTLLL